MSVREFWMRFAVLLFAFVSTAAGSQPNILLMVADDLGWNDVGYNGSEIKTPAIDQLAAEGLRLDRYYAFPYCTPTRVAIMTGRSPLRFGMAGPIIDHGGLPLDETTLGDVFQDAGYQTWFMGKWHIGHEKRAHFPNERGWEHSYGSLTGGLDHYSHNSDVLMGVPDWHRNGMPVEETGHTTDLYTQEALELIRGRDPSKPFLLYLAWNAPHTALQAPERYVKRYEGIDNELRRIYAAMVAHLDDSVAALVEGLDKEGLRDNTLVIWSSANGGEPVGGADNGRLRGAKGSPYEGGVRVPGLVHWSGKIKPGIMSQLTSAHDWLSTLAAAAGIPSDTEKPLDGFNMWPAIASRESVGRGDLVLGSRFGRTVLRGRWKYVEAMPRGPGPGFRGGGRGPAQGPPGGRAGP